MKTYALFGNGQTSEIIYGDAIPFADGDRLQLTFPGLPDRLIQDSANIGCQAALANLIPYRYITNDTRFAFTCGLSKRSARLGGHGDSAGLAFCLHFVATYHPPLQNLSPLPNIAATGVLNEARTQAPVEPIDYINEKLIAALGDLKKGDLIFYPKENQGEVDPSLVTAADQQEVELIPVATAEQAIEVLLSRCLRDVQSSAQTKPIPTEDRIDPSLTQIDAPQDIEPTGEARPLTESGNSTSGASNTPPQPKTKPRPLVLILIAAALSLVGYSAYNYFSKPIAFKAYMTAFKTHMEEGQYQKADRILRQFTDHPILPLFESQLHEPLRFDGEFYYKKGQRIPRNIPYRFGSKGARSGTLKLPIGKYYQLVIHAVENSYFYIFHMSTTGQITALPDKLNAAPLHITAATSDSTTVYSVEDGPPGREMLVFFGTRIPNRALEASYRALLGATAEERPKAQKRLRRQLDQIIVDSKTYRGIYCDSVVYVTVAAE